MSTRNFLIGIVLLSFPFCMAQDAAMFRGNLQHTGVYAAPGVPKLSGVKWKFHAGGMVIGSPSIAGGLVYVGSTQGGFYAVDAASGTQKWKFDTKTRVVSTPAIANGTVYFTEYFGNLYALDAATGKMKWKFTTEGERRYAAKHLHGAQPAAETMPDPFDSYLSSPAVWNGAVYFGSSDGNVYSVNAETGALNWRFKTGEVVHASPAIADGTVFVGSWDSYFYAIDAATGHEKWKFKTGDDPDTHNQVGIQSSAAVVDGVVYFGCRDSHLYALDAATGVKKWDYPTSGSWVVASPAVTDGVVYFPTSDSSTLFAVDARTGKSLRSLSFNKWYLFSSPAIAGNMIYLGTTQGKLAAVELSDLNLSWTFQADGSKAHAAEYTKADGSPDFDAMYRSDFADDMVVGVDRIMQLGAILSSPVVAGDTVYVGSADGNLYAIE